MLKPKERVELIQMMANVDDIYGVLTEDQKLRLKNVTQRINNCYRRLLEGVPKS